LILAKAGVLQGVKSCTHWACLQELASYGATPVRKRFVDSGKYVSASGVSAGIDMALYLLKRLVSRSHARDIRFGIEYFPNQFHVINSYSLPMPMLAKLAQRFKHVFERARQHILNQNS
jgi:transcriptional regulator GlxA family with amidase domain